MKKSQAGQTIIEILMATGVVALVMTTVVSVMSVAVKNASAAKAADLSTKYTQEGMEVFRKERTLMGWGNYYALLQSKAGGGSTVTYCLPAALPVTVTDFTNYPTGACNSSQFVDPKNVFQRKAVVTINSVSLITVTVTTSWQDGGRNRQSQIVEQFNNWSVDNAPIPTQVPGSTPVPTAPPTPTPAGVNVAPGHTVSESSTYPGSPATMAIDGNTSGLYNASSNPLAITNSDQYAWWQEDLGAQYLITSINIFNRTDCCGARESNFYVFVSASPFDSNNPSTLASESNVNSYFVTGPAGSPSTLSSIYVTGRYVRVQLTTTDFLQLAEVQIFSPTTPPTPPPTPTPTPIIKLPVVGTAASNTLAGSSSSYAADSNYGTAWNAGVDPSHAQRWVELDLGAARTITSIKLYVNQSPNGPTSHTLNLGPPSDSVGSVYNVWSGYTTSGQVLTYTPASPISGIEYVLITTTTSPSWVSWTEIEVYGY